VSYLNTVPLVWGMQHGPQAAEVDLSFSIPSECARDVENGGAQVGLVPVAEIARQGLEIVPGVGISCLGAVRSILLFSKVPWPEIRHLAADLSSRTSVQLARVILRERFGVQPRITQARPVLGDMLTLADAALVIGDPALCLDPEREGFACLDLGDEWHHLTRLPFVFAAWSGKPGIPVDPLELLFRKSYEFGKARIPEIVEQQHALRSITKDLAARYLTQHIRFEIGRDEERGLQAFFELADLAKPVFAGGGV
jgi:predicted solute-binding protein